MAAVVALSAGCVSTGKYDDLRDERDALAVERDALVEEQQVLAAELDSVRAENEEMKSTYGQLVRELQAEVEAGQITIQRVVDGIRLGVSDELLFRSGGVSLDAEATALLARVAGQIKSQDAIVFVEGHTDDVQVGSNLKARYPTNWELAGARAALVVRKLSENGVDPERLRAVSRGPFDPLVPNDSPENRARNRRTEIILRNPPKV
jgi:chemotaxis protein MotB